MEKIVIILDEVSQAYYKLNPNGSIMIHNGKWDIVEQKKDVSNYYFGLCDDDSLNLFKHFSYWIEDESSSLRDSGEIYACINNQNVAIYNVHSKKFFDNQWLSKGDSVVVNQERYIANCKIDCLFSFDDVRRFMYSKKLIPSFEMGKATDEEILEVFLNVHTYLEENDIIPNKGSRKLK